MRLRFRFFFVEAIRSLRNNMATTLAATVTVLIVMTFLGVFISLGSYMYAKVEDVRNDVKIDVYLADSASKQQIFALRAKLNADDRVEAVEYVSKKEALQRMRQRLGADSEILEQLPVNPLPAKFEVKTRDPDQTKAVALSLQGAAGIEKGDNGIKYGGTTADRILRNGAIVEAVVGGVIVLLSIAAVLLIANTIRLSIFARRREVEVMKLVGATNWFVRWPFMLEGMICGMLGAVCAVLLLYLGYETVLRDFIEGSSVGEQNVEGISFGLLALVLLAAGTGLGALGSGLTMRRFLRV